MKINKLKKESITTVSAGIPGEGPIANTQNGIHDDGISVMLRRKNKKLLKKSIFNMNFFEDEEDDDNLDEGLEFKIDKFLYKIDRNYINLNEEKITIEDIIDALDKKTILKLKSSEKALKYIQSKIDELKDIFGSSVKINIHSLELYLEKMFKDEKN